MGIGLHAKRSTNIEPGARPEAPSSTKKTSDSERGTYNFPDLPPGSNFATPFTAAPVHTQGVAFGLMKPAVAGTLVAATLVSAGTATAGAQVLDLPADAPSTVERVSEAPAPKPGGVARFNSDMQTLELMLARGEITADQKAAAREVLYRAHVLGMTQNAPKDERGQITVASVLRGDPAQALQAQTKGQKIMDQLTRDLERRMRITARDMARGNFTPIEGLPGYKEIPQAQVQRLFTDAFKRIPIGELPFGAQLTNAIDRLPGLENVDVGSMSYEELRKQVRDDVKDALDARFGDFVDDHKIEVGVVAFAAVTGLRAASPEAAKLLDQTGMRLDAWKTKSKDGQMSTRGRLVWRDQHVWPDLDIEGQVNHRVGDHVTLRGQVTGTASIEADNPFTGKATVGAHYTDDGLWLDAAGTYTYPEDRWRASVTGGYTDPDTQLRVSGGLTSTFGDKVAVGDASGRGTLQIDLGQDLDFGGDKTGYWGVYGGVTADTDLQNRDFGVGVIFKLQF